LSLLDLLLGAERPLSTFTHYLYDKEVLVSLPEGNYDARASAYRYRVSRLMVPWSWWRYRFQLRMSGDAVPYPMLDDHDRCAVNVPIEEWETPISHSDTLLSPYALGVPAFIGMVLSERMRLWGIEDVLVEEEGDDPQVSLTELVDADTRASLQAQLDAIIADDPPPAGTLAAKRADLLQRAIALLDEAATAVEELVPNVRPLEWSKFFMDLTTKADDKKVELTVYEAASCQCAEPGDFFHYRIQEGANNLCRLVSDPELLLEGDKDRVFNTVDEATAFCQAREDEAIALLTGGCK